MVARAYDVVHCRAVEAQGQCLSKRRQWKHKTNAASEQAEVVEAQGKGTGLRWSAGTPDEAVQLDTVSQEPGALAYGVRQVPVDVCPPPPIAQRRHQRAAANGTAHVPWKMWCAQLPDSCGKMAGITRAGKQSSVGLSGACTDDGIPLPAAQCVERRGELQVAEAVAHDVLHA